MTNRQLRLLHFWDECNRQRRLAYQNGETVTDTVLAVRASRSPAPAYYVEYDYARRHLSAIKWSVLPANSPRGLMWAEIAQRVHTRMKRSTRMTLNDALAAVLSDGHASSFFICPDYARRLYSHLKSRRRHDRRRIAKPL